MVWTARYQLRQQIRMLVAVARLYAILHFLPNSVGWGNIEGHQTLTQILDRNPFTLSVRTTSGSCGNNLLNIPVNLDKKVIQSFHFSLLS